VEEAIGQRVGLEPGDRRRRMLAGVREHVVPLEDLVQDDPVDEPSEAQAEEEPGGAGQSGRDGCGGG
jgi:hypothetical protein